MNTSFKANAAQHKAFIASVKKGFFFTKLSHLKLELASFWTEKYDWAINDVITFYTATGKYFVVKASDLLVSVDDDTNKFMENTVEFVKRQFDNCENNANIF